ncbi:MAG TPA: sulfatase-like hydrolase/transferase [Acidobacteriota bacterium]|nr:sulfatase-like hydrolase/transferase [Acidobacteriota bacterium]
MPSFERGRRMPQPGALAALALVASVSAIVLLATGCGPGASPGARLDQLRGDRKLNVLLVTLDTTRADRLGVYGFDEVDTPAVDALADGGVTFMRAYASTPLTLPSHASLLTGTHPPYHGVRDNGVHVAPEELQTLAESFQEAGYRTGAFVGAFVLDSRWGLAQGFDRYFDDFELPRQRMISLSTVQRPGSEVVDTALAWAREDDTTPFFMWVHLYDPHTPYEPPEPFRSQYADRPYVGEIAWTDSLVGRLTSWLDESGRSDDTYVVVAADHGESLGEHGENEHGLLLYESAIRVPLIIATPFDEPRGVQRHELVSLIDVMPTVLELTGLETPEEVHGQSLVPLFTSNADVEGRPDERVYAETFYPRLHFGWSELQAIIEPTHKLIISPEPELYDLLQDPEEEQNLAPQRAATAEALRREAEELVAQVEENANPAGTVTLDQETRQRLAALGYIGNASVDADAPGVERANPRDKIEIYNDLLRARRLTVQNEPDKAEVALRRIIAADGGVVDAHQSLGNLLVAQLRYDEAIETFETALSMRPEDAALVLLVASTQRQAGRLDEAEKVLLDFIDILEPDARLYVSLGRIKQATRSYTEATAHFNEALRLSEDAPANNVMAGAHVGLGAVQLASGRLRLAEEHLNLARGFNDNLADLHFQRGLLFQARQQPNEAIAAYRREIEISPRNGRAAFNLSVIYRNRGNLVEEERYLRLALEINPQFASGRLFLARIYLVKNERLDEAVSLVEGALERLESSTAQGVPQEITRQDQVLAHLLLADIYNRLGRNELSTQHARLGNQLRTGTRR